MTTLLHERSSELLGKEKANLLPSALLLLPFLVKVRFPEYLLDLGACLYWYSSDFLGIVDNVQQRYSRDIDQQMLLSEEKVRAHLGSVAATRLAGSTTWSNPVLFSRVVLSRM